ncbi:FkbM family methyltransferase [Solirubrobacter pauli]|uniref:FkbM family methyltransferase n=1 Tax=Solirubrobacter pauli TaxID=166793 RepID=A0A660LFU0_9ACTN|nr:FkbM family methyltransferase [Solirubrobacter pauli]RKQ91784.1 FkbM family methyltransferase [Solirubrobacter pauli]
MSDEYERRTGGASDRLRHLYRVAGARRLRHVDAAVRAVYVEWQRWRFATLLASDLESYRAYRRADRRGGHAHGATERVRVKPLGGHAVELRPGTSDAQMLRETFRDNVHRPERTARARTIVDIGANIGITVADNALRHPNARIVAVELDAGNVELARRNTARWADRVQLMHGAAWVEDGEITYVAEHGQEFGFFVDAGGEATAPAFSMATILSHVPADERIDFLKMDVEGVEAKLLVPATPHWADRVDEIALQVHHDYTIEDCVRDLTALGFDAARDPRRIDFVRGQRSAG